MSIPPGDPVCEAIQEINSTARRATDLIRQLLAFSRRQVIEPRVVILNAVLIEMEKMLHRLIGEDIELTITTSDGLWPVKVDPGQIEQVLTNLVVNARDAIPAQGRITIETANESLDDEYVRSHSGVTPGDYVMMAVSDTGVGMDNETVRKKEAGEPDWGWPPVTVL